MFATIVILILICAVLLIVVVLAQNPKGGGLSDQFGGSSSSQLIGVKRTGDLLEKLTWGLLVAIFVLAIGSKMALSGGAPEEDDAEVDKTEITNSPTQQPEVQPGTGTTDSEDGE